MPRGLCAKSGIIRANKIRRYRGNLAIHQDQWNIPLSNLLEVAGVEIFVRG
jgi:hypothetical protein